MTTATADAAVKLVDEAERAVLGTLMVSLDDNPAADALEPADFYRPAHGRILAAIRKAPSADPVTVAEVLLSDGDLARVGGVDYIHACVAAAMVPGSVERHVGLIKRARDRRRRTELLAELGRAGADDDAWSLRAPELLAELSGHTAPPAERDSWAPLDLGPYLRGEILRPEPTVGASRTDGLRFIYPGKEHSVIGEMEAGKSWFCLACVAAELGRGNTVVYVHFEEADPSDTIERLQVLGVPDDLIATGFRFVAPTVAITPQQITRLLDPAPSMVVLDGVNEGMAMHGAAIREEDGVAAFRRRLIKPFIAAGAAVLSADHVVKDKESRGRYALGSIHKGNALSGALILLENSEPFGRGQRGASQIYVTKDRPGHLRRHGQGTKTSGKTFMGMMVVDDTRTRVHYLDLALIAPVEKPAGPAETSEDDRVFDAVCRLVEQGETANLRSVRATVDGVRDSNVDMALERLRLAGRLVERAGPNRSRIFTPGVAQDPYPGGSE